MSKSTVTNFVSKIDDVLSDYTINDVKESIGDSTNNNRALTVSQTIRFFRTIGQSTLAKDLTTVYTDDTIRTVLQQFRNRKNNRQDAFDINELTHVLTSYQSAQRQVGKLGIKQYKVSASVA